MYDYYYGEQIYNRLGVINDNITSFQETSTESYNNLYDLELRQTENFVVFTGCLNLIMMIILITQFLPKRKELKKNV